MWPILLQFLRSNAPYLTLPFAAVIGVVGYNLEGYFSDRYTPYNTNCIMEPRERTLILMTPDGVQQGIGNVIKCFEKKGFKLVGLKLVQPSEELQKHYSALPSQFKNISSGPFVPMVWEGTNVVKTARLMVGATNLGEPLIRSDLSVTVGRNGIYGSDSVEAARIEIALWFSEEELVKWKSVTEEWVYE